jgi:hypothetical protein
LKPWCWSADAMALARMSQRLRGGSRTLRLPTSPQSPRTSGWVKSITCTESVHQDIGAETRLIPTDLRLPWRGIRGGPMEKTHPAKPSMSHPEPDRAVDRTPKAIGNSVKSELSPNRQYCCCIKSLSIDASRKPIELIRNRCSLSWSL